MSQSASSSLSDEFLLLSRQDSDKPTDAPLLAETDATPVGGSRNVDVPDSEVTQLTQGTDDLTIEGDSQSKKKNRFRPGSGSRPRRRGVAHKSTSDLLSLYYFPPIDERSRVDLSLTRDDINNQSREDEPGTYSPGSTSFSGSGTDIPTYFSRRSHSSAQVQSRQASIDQGFNSDAASPSPESPTSRRKGPIYYDPLKALSRLTNYLSRSSSVSKVPISGTENETKVNPETGSQKMRNETRPRRKQFSLDSQPNSKVPSRIPSSSSSQVAFTPLDHFSPGIQRSGAGTPLPASLISSPAVLPTVGIDPVEVEGEMVEALPSLRLDGGEHGLAGMPVRYITPDEDTVPTIRCFDWRQ